MPHIRDLGTNCALLLVVDKHSKKFVSVYKFKDSYDIPGGKCIMYENSIEGFEDCAVRELQEETGLKVDKANMFKILDANDGKFRVVTYVSNLYSGNFYTVENHRVGWVPLEFLKFNANQGWRSYNTLVYNRLISRLY